MDDNERSIDLELVFLPRCSRYCQPFLCPAAKMHTTRIDGIRSERANLEACCEIMAMNLNENTVMEPWKTQNTTYRPPVPTNKRQKRGRDILKIFFQVKLPDGYELRDGYNHNWLGGMLYVYTTANSTIILVGCLRPKSETTT